MAHLKRLLGILTLMMGFNLLQCDSTTILLLPDEVKSHVFEHANIGTELVKNGNKVYILLSDKFEVPNSVERGGIEVIRYHAENPFFIESDEFVREFLASSLNSSNPFEIFSIMGEGYKKACDNILGNSALMQKLDSIRFDLALLYGFPPGMCFYLIPYKLSVPYATLFSLPSLFDARVPSLPSFVPNIGPPGQPVTPEMTFYDRLQNTLAILGFPLAIYFMSSGSQDLVPKHLPNESQLQLRTLHGRTKLWLMDKDLTLDYPSPSMPNIIDVGGLTTSPSKPLPEALHKLVTEAANGVIVVSFGTIATHLPHEINMKLMDAFRQLKELVIWRYNGPNLDESPNVKTLKWLPQNDLLGHNNTRLFITHCGTNGQSEAVYHGVPMIGLPIQPEQDYNAARMQYKGFGVRMDLKRFTSEELVNNINLVLKDQSYRTAIEKASQIFRSRPMNPRQRAAYWLEHIAKYGSDHLHSYALEMPLYQFLMLDILLFLFLVVMVLVLSIYFVLRVCMAICCKSKPKIKVN